MNICKYIKKTNVSLSAYLTFSQSLRLTHFVAVLKVDDTEAFPNYPYRDDAMLIFEVIYDYVREVLEAFYGKHKNIYYDQ